MEMKETSEVVGVQIKDLPLPEGVVVGAIVRNDELLMGSKKLSYRARGPRFNGANGCWKNSRS